MVKGQFSIAESVPFEDPMVGRLSVPAGFKVSVWAKDLGDPRNVTFAADGSAYVARPKKKDVVLLRDALHVGRADAPIVLATGIANANDVALHAAHLYITSASQVLMADRAMDGTLGPRHVVLSGLPEGGRHY